VTVAGPPPTAGAQEAAGAVERTLEAVQRAIFRYPVATKAAFRALVAEGRRYAETTEGAELLTRLQGSPAVERARLLWEVVGVRAFADDAEALPGFFVDRLAEALRMEPLEPILGRVMGRWLGR
jgi:hypothetical protein